MWISRRDPFRLTRTVAGDTTLPTLLPTPSPLKIFLDFDDALTSFWEMNAEG
jgi:hypothetical protein